MELDTYICKTNMKHFVERKTRFLAHKKIKKK